MKYILMYHKIPLSAEQFRVASFYAFMKNLLELNKQQGDARAYEMEDKRVEGDKILMKFDIKPKNHPSKSVRGIIPKGWELIMEDYTLNGQFSSSVYDIVNRRESGEGAVYTFCSPVKLQPTSDAFPPEMRAVLAEAGPKLKTCEYDLTRKGDAEFCFVYRLAKYQLNIFGKTLIEGIIPKVMNSSYASVAKTALKSRKEWEDKDIDDMRRILDGDVQVDELDANEYEICVFHFSPENWSRPPHNSKNQKILILNELVRTCESAHSLSFPLLFAFSPFRFICSHIYFSHSTPPRYAPVHEPGGPGSSGQVPRQVGARQDRARDLPAGQVQGARVRPVHDPLGREGVPADGGPGLRREPDAREPRGVGVVQKEVDADPGWTDRAGASGRGGERGLRGGRVNRFGSGRTDLAEWLRRVTQDLLGVKSAWVQTPQSVFLFYF